jgi:hypothetical protein
MRISIFTSDIDKTASEGVTVLDGVNSSSHALTNDSLYVTGYGWPTLKLDSRRVYPLERRHKLRTKFFCNLLSAIDNNKRIPASLALIAVYFIQREIFDTLLSFVPDALILSGLRWNKEFRFFIKRKMPDLPCYCKHDRIELPPEGHWKKYDPSVKVSIVLPTYNGAKYIRKSINSCLEQTHSNLELIIVDDFSTDETPQIINSYSDKRIKYIRHPTNLKLPRALNTGFKHATGEYLTWTSDDNFYDVNAIETMLKFLLTYPQIDYVYTDEYHIDENDNINKYFAVGPVESLQLDNLIGGCFLYHRRVYEEIGEYDPDTYLAEDYDYWIRISKRFRMQRLRIPLYYYRLHKDSLTVKYGKYGTKLAGEVGDIVKKRHKK